MSGNATPLILKGRIVIYSIVGCPHCLAAKSKLQDLRLPFTDVGVDRFPSHVRTWVKERTEKTSVPQIFFNKTYIGGNAEFQSLVQNEEKFQEILNDVIENENPDESDPLLPSPSEALDTAKNVEFHCELDEYAVFVQELKTSGIVKSHRTGCLFTKKLRDSFNGKDFVDWVMKKKDVSQEKAIEMGQELINRKFGFLSMSANEKEEEFKYDSSAIYQLGSGLNSSALNADKVNECAQRKAGEVAEDMRKMILQIFNAFLSKDGKKVDYKGIKNSSMFQDYKSIARELQRVDLKEFSRKDKLAFFINTYNALVIHGNIERGTPSNTWQR